jgi:beta-ribofuranosylaminobenzene 5'-phosphate synthase
MRRLLITAPSRLHFGLYGFGSTLTRQFGGIGAMIDSPSVELELAPAATFSVAGPLAERVHTFAERWRVFHDRGELPSCHIAVRNVPPEHSGLGVGTQLGLSVAAALNAWSNVASVTPAELALSVGRGLRSAVGTYGFVHGGLVAERGKLASETISPLDMRVALPDEWRFVLVTAQRAKGLAGQAEMHAFQALPAVPPATTEKLIALARLSLLPAAMQADFEQFSAALFEYCETAGMCFAEVQGGPYNGSVLSELVAAMRGCGAGGAGQSSWGPTLFALLPNDQAAAEFVARLRAAVATIEFNVHIAMPNNHGARLTWNDG